MNGSLVCFDDVVDLEKDNDEFGEDYMCEIIKEEDGGCKEDKVHEIVVDDDSKIMKKRRWRPRGT